MVHLFLCRLPRDKHSKRLPRRSTMLQKVPSFLDLTPSHQKARLESLYEITEGEKADMNELIYEIACQAHLMSNSSMDMSDMITISVEMYDKDQDRMLKTEHLQKNLGSVHFELAAIEASGRFHVVDERLRVVGESGNDVAVQEAVSHAALNPVADIPSCVFHLCEAARLMNRPALLALGRLTNGLTTSLLPILNEYIRPCAECSMCLLRIAAKLGSAAAAVLCAQLLQTKDGRYGTYKMYGVI